MTLDLGSPEGRRIMLQLAEESDVVIENFRPDTLERWGLGYDELSAVNSGIVLARVTGFGQIGPSRRKPGFGTLAEAMSGFAALTGEPDGPPTLPPFGLADGIASLATAFAILAALRARETTGRGQVVDIAIIEPIMWMMTPQITQWDQQHTVQQRTGNRSAMNAPRNTYLTKDGRWVAISTSAQSVAERVVRLVGREELISEPWFATGAGRAGHADLLDAAVGTWIAERTRDEVLAEFEAANAAVAPIYDASDIVEDPHLRELGTILTIEDDDFGSMRMQNVLFRLSDTPGAVRFTGRRHGQDTDEILTGLGLSAADIARLRAASVI
jgi:crotonobetainyl-CoA:carnitine CoA-transferase CaiB-like acyl-CoA transferase